MLCCIAESNEGLAAWKQRVLITLGYVACFLLVGCSILYLITRRRFQSTLPNSQYRDIIARSRDRRTFPPFRRRHCNKSGSWPSHAGVSRRTPTALVSDAVRRRNAAKMLKYIT